MRFFFAKLMRSLPTQGERGLVTPRTAMGLTLALLVALFGAVSRDLAAQATAPTAAAAPSHSTTIALTSDEQRLVVVNREAKQRLDHPSEKQPGNYLEDVAARSMWTIRWSSTTTRMAARRSA